MEKRFIVTLEESLFDLRGNHFGSTKIIHDNLTGIDYLMINDGSQLGGITPLLNSEDRKNQR